MPVKRGKTADGNTADPVPVERVQASHSSHAMQAVWDQAHLSRCASRLRSLGLELATAQTQDEHDALQGRMEKLQHLMKEAGYDAEAI